MTMDIFHFPVLSSFMTYHRVCNYINKTKAPEFTPDFYCGSCYSIFSFVCMFWRSLFVVLSNFLLAIVFSVLLRFTDSDNPFGIFKLFSIISKNYLLKPNRLQISNFMRQREKEVVPRLYEVDKFHFCRVNRNSNGEGVIVYVTSKHIMWQETYIWV